METKKIAHINDAVWPFQNSQTQSKAALVLSILGFILIAYAGPTFSIFGLPFNSQLVAFSFFFLAAYYIIAE